ncbi:hypothetical protein CLAFUW4_12842 [Fulvia fulva]|uniref:Metallo-beta-lactamase domain-containing protein n=1 Tax=Passalora fulva TaxID=5499 RepID=A0A9Q8PK67_PASFU|nr:uncharacterized protein CLAFUR5_12708 [Fulvia fulva]KAK4611901.1 hypothetical protein CLAFUR4_12846 [Fulvia fulva]KAK4612552.1 hypothetical protein CLAFUR0_12852 [Fulvia fulva]UJO23917.1 hypothetical protein CLAFUR5_12708 [Fulvia fulva]WPV21213.1 hypothetical protein CLAFUW4_12842 [Fulvia fulva]WPV36497.1 hypothetical protein CLAFUW7_12850 [Fulvia fulva]
MSVTVHQSTADSTFLVTFAPPFAPARYEGKFPGSFSILFDPWLDGASIVGHPKFATNKHTHPAAIPSLADVKDVDMIVVSQEKSDHLHEETLRTLPKDTKVKILATPKAAKKIYEWNYFTDPSIIRVMSPYNAAKDDTVIRIPIEAYSSTSAEGEVTITNISEKRDITGLHNAIGVTYCPPGTLLRAADGTTVKMSELPGMASSRPNTAKSSTSSPSSQSPKPARQRYLRGSLDDIEYYGPSIPRQPPDNYDATTQKPSQNRADPPRGRPTTSGSRQPTAHGVGKRLDNYEKVLTTLYTPHGIESTKLRSYLSQHLHPLNGALPLTVLFHSMNVESNPWWMGGLISAGAPGGVKVAKEVDARYWISAHDEIKDSSGFAVSFIKKQVYTAEHTTKLLREAEGIGGGRGIGTEVCVLGCGGERRFVG